MSSYHAQIKKKYKVNGINLFRKGCHNSLDKIVVNGILIKKDLVIEYIKNGRLIDFIETKKTSSKGAYRSMSKDPVFTHCEYCGLPLPEEELKMQTCCHRECWLLDIGR